MKQKLNYAKKNWGANTQRYNNHISILGSRNSFSKTDNDATFMRMKEDHMRNGQLKAAYNVQISTNNQFIINYSHHQNPNDTLTLVNHLKQFEALYNKYPKLVVADAGYGSEENYVNLKRMHINAYIKYNYFDKDNKSKAIDNFQYDKENKCYICPQGHTMQNTGSYKRKTRNGFTQTYKTYKCSHCLECPQKHKCCPNGNDKIININHRLQSFKDSVFKKLNTEKGVIYRKNRCVEVEPVFGNIKQNKGFKRFNLRGLIKSEIETGLLALAHNIAKMTV